MNLTANDIAIQAFETEGLVGHVDIDNKWVAQLKLSLDRAPQDEKYLFTPELLNFHQCHLTKSKDMRVYYVASNGALSEVVNVAVKTANKVEFSKHDSYKTLRGVISRLAPNISHTETRIITMLRQKERKQRFFSVNRMLSIEETLDVLGVGDSNATRAISKLIKENQVIALEKNGKRVFPAFQFDVDGEVYPCLLEAMKKCAIREVTSFDLCYWLTDFASVLLNAPVDEEDYKGWSFEDMMLHSEELNKQSEIFEGKPLDALIEGDTGMFERLLEDMLSPYDFNVHGTG